MVHRCIYLSFVVACSVAVAVGTQSEKGESCPASGCDIDSIVVDESSLLARHRSAVRHQSKLAMDQPMQGRDQQMGKGKGKADGKGKGTADGHQNSHQIEQHSEKHEEQHKG